MQFTPTLPHISCSLEANGIVLPIITPNAAFGGLYRRLTARYLNFEHLKNVISEILII